MPTLQALGLALGEAMMAQGLGLVVEVGAEAVQPVAQLNILVFAVAEGRVKTAALLEELARQ